MPPTKINSRWIKDLSCDTIKVLEENIGRKISGIPCSNIFTDIFLTARDIRDKKNKWDYIRLKASAWLKKTNKMERNKPYGKTYLPVIPRTRV